MKPLAKLLTVGAGFAAASYATYIASAWLRYGRVKPTHDDELLDAFMPAYDVYEQHAIAVDAPADVALAAAKSIDLAESRIVRAIFRARGLILRSKPGVRAQQGLFEDMKAMGWGVLADVPGREVVMGAVTKPWQADPVFRPLPPDEFAVFAEPDYVKIAWTLRADPSPLGGSTFRTDTRAVATDAGARRKFRRYWSLLSPGIILIRSAMMPALKAAAERAWRIEGDDILSNAHAQLTHATTIAAPPKDVWPWLIQMGCRRGGWYSWDRLDNAGVRSADHIIPELQHLAIGDVLPVRPVGDEGFEVVRIVPERALVLRGTSPAWTGTWAFVLEPLGPAATRLVTRYRAAYPPSVKLALLVPAMTAIHAVMERKQLRTIKHHVEHMHSS